MATELEISTDRIKQKALALGFDHCGIAKASVLHEDRQYLDQRIEQGGHAGMEYLVNNRDVRANPDLVLPGVRSVIVTLLNYYSPEYTGFQDVRFSRYAYGDNYHDVVKHKLNRLSKFISENHPETVNRACVDSVPIFEKAWAQKAGLGWIGKNCILINKDHGSFHFIGILLSTLELNYDAPETDRCGQCTRCLEACPTQAFSGPRWFDARKCISYLTISHKGDLPLDAPQEMHNYIYGCDICQDVCPFNRHASPTQEPAFAPRTEILSKSAADWESTSTEEFKAITNGSVIGEKSLGQILRNILHLKKPGQ